MNNVHIKVIYFLFTVQAHSEGMSFFYAYTSLISRMHASKRFSKWSFTMSLKFNFHFSSDSRYKFY